MRDFEANILSKYPASELITDIQFASAVAKIQGEFLAVHPFREGNTRTIKLISDVLAVQTDRPVLVYDSTLDGLQQHFTAAMHAINMNYSPMEEVISEALTRAETFSRKRITYESIPKSAEKPEQLPHEKQSTSPPKSNKPKHKL